MILQFLDFPFLKEKHKDLTDQNSNLTHYRCGPTKNSIWELFHQKTKSWWKIAKSSQENVVKYLSLTGYGRWLKHKTGVGFSGLSDVDERKKRKINLLRG